MAEQGAEYPAESGLAPEATPVEVSVNALFPKFDPQRIELGLEPKGYILPLKADGDKLVGELVARGTPTNLIFIVGVLYEPYKVGLDLRHNEVAMGILDCGEDFSVIPRLIEPFYMLDRTLPLVVVPETGIPFFFEIEEDITSGLNKALELSRNIDGVSYRFSCLLSERGPYQKIRDVLRPNIIINLNSSEELVATIYPLDVSVPESPFYKTYSVEKLSLL